MRNQRDGRNKRSKRMTSKQVEVIEISDDDKEEGGMDQHQGGGAQKVHPIPGSGAQMVDSIPGGGAQMNPAPGGGIQMIPVPRGGAQIQDDQPESEWYFFDPEGIVQGPFSVTALKLWRDAGFFPPALLVWKKDQARQSCVFLSDLLRKTFK